MGFMLTLTFGKNSIDFYNMTILSIEQLSQLPTSYVKLPYSFFSMLRVHKANKLIYIPSKAENDDYRFEDV